MEGSAHVNQDSVAQSVLSHMNATLRIYNRIIGALSCNQCGVYPPLLTPFKESLPATQPRRVAVAVIKAWHICSHAPPHHISFASQGGTPLAKPQEEASSYPAPRLLTVQSLHLSYFSYSGHSLTLHGKQLLPCCMDLRWPVLQIYSTGCKDGTHSFVPRAVSTMPVFASSTRRSCASMALVTACIHMMRTTSH